MNPPDEGDVPISGRPAGEQPLGAFCAELIADVSPPTLRVRGEVDVMTAPLLTAALEVAIRTGSAVDIDLSEVTFMDSQGLRAFIEARNSAGPSVSLVITAAPPNVSRVFETTGLAASFGLPTNSL